MLTRRSAIRNIGAMLLSAAVMLASLSVPGGLTASAQTPAPSVSGNLTVYAAASLTDAFNEIGKNFRAQYPNTTVRFSFAGSQQLAEQIGFGAPADVFASANQRLMDAVVKTTRIEAGEPRTFVRNRLVVIYPKRNAAGVRRLQDLSKAGIKLVLAAKAVPVGGYSLDFLNKASAKSDFGADFSAKVLANVVSYETDVRGVFSKVALDEADAGIVYSSDVVADKAKDVGTIDIPSDLNTIATYPIAALKDSPNLPLAQAFTKYILSPAAQTVLVKYGFISTTGDATGAAPKAGTLLVTGLVSKPTTVQSAALKRLKQVSVQATDRNSTEQMYTGPSIADVLKLAGVKPEAKTVTFIGGDGYSQDIAISALSGSAGVITIDANGAFRNVVPASAPKFWVKGLIKLEVS